jgi:transposase
MILEPIQEVVESGESDVIHCRAPSWTRGCSMWTPDHRRAADRRGLRYASDLTDAEWALVQPAIPPAKRGGRPRDVNVREVLNAIFFVPRPAASGTPCRRTCRRRARRTTTSCCGTGTARWSASITCFMSPRANARAAKRARRQRSSTVKAPRQLKRGLHARPAGLRCG